MTSALIVAGRAVDCCGARSEADCRCSGERCRVCRCCAACCGCDEHEEQAIGGNPAAVPGREGLPHGGTDTLPACAPTTVQP